MDFERDQEQLNRSTHPWQGFAHPNHQAAEYEALQKTLRFALIQFNKFWVEVNSFPVFMNAMKGASVREIERLFTWLQTSPAWNKFVTQPHLISDLSRPPLRKALLDFAEDVRRARLLRAELGGFQEKQLPDFVSLQTAQAHLAIAMALSRQLGLESSTQADVRARIDEVSARLGRNQRLQAFFSSLASTHQLPESLSLREAGRVFHATELLRRTPAKVLAWRKPQILGAQQKIRIEAWQDRAKPLVEARKRLHPHFKLEEGVTADGLRALAAQLRAGGTFRAFNSGYKENLKSYQALLATEPGSKGPTRENPIEMAEKLAEWASYLEQKAVFDSNPEAASFFAPQFRGLDTDFAGALAAQAWATGVRAEFKVVDPASSEDLRDAAFCAQLTEWLFTAPAASLQGAVDTCAAEPAIQVQGILLESEYATGREFAAVGCEEEARLLEATRLRESLMAVSLRAEAPLHVLSRVRAAVEELLVLLRRMDSAVEVKASLKNFYAGEATDLALIENALAYVEYVESAGLPEGLKNTFTTAYGPQRLHDSRNLVAPAMNGLAAVKEHLNRLDVATHGQSRSLENLPLLDLNTRIQAALRQPAALGEWVQKLRSNETSAL